jgi:uncharacterized DUF497 family protein
LRVEWERAKNEINLAKHGVDRCVTFLERVVDGEELWYSIGSIEQVIVLAVVDTYREKAVDLVVRIISARPATRRDGKLYAPAIG